MEKKSSQKIPPFAAILLDWFGKNGREYPWRKERDPYRILIAEVMLQRTRADQVVPVYLKFIKVFPGPESLSKARRKDILGIFRHLGLLWRIDRIMELGKALLYHHGIVPSDYASLRSLPGVGTYVADAVTVFAFNGRRTVVDANVIRLVSRYFGIKVKGEARRKKNFVAFCQELSESVPERDVKSLNWALIDLPAAICRPKPLCHTCPLRDSCHFYNEEH